MSLAAHPGERVTPGFLPSAPSGPACGRSRSRPAIPSATRPSLRIAFVPLFTDEPCGSCRGARYFGLPALHPFGAGLRPFAIALRLTTTSPYPSFKPTGATVLRPHNIAMQNRTSNSPEFPTGSPRGKPYHIVAKQGQSVIRYLDFRHRGVRSPALSSRRSLLDEQQCSLGR